MDEDLDAGRIYQKRSTLNAQPAFVRQPQDYGAAGVKPPIRRSEKNIILRRLASCSILTSVSSVVSQDPEILGGEPVFAGTRVPVKSLFDHLEAGDSIEQFLEGFPSVKREQVIALLEEAREHALSAS